MLRVEVSGSAGEGKSGVLDLIRDVLHNAGKRVLVVEDNRVAQRPVGNVDIVLAVDRSSSYNHELDFLVGLTESAAYELAQDHGFLVRVVKRNDISFIYTMEVNPKRVNLSIVDNTVVAWSIG